MKTQTIEKAIIVIETKLRAVSLGEPVKEVRLNIFPVPPLIGLFISIIAVIVCALCL